MKTTHKDLVGKIVVVTGMRRLPKACKDCSFYENMGGQSGPGNDGACRALSYRSTRSIAVSKDRLPECPLVDVNRETLKDIYQKFRWV